MNTDAHITLTRGDSRDIVVPVWDDDHDVWYDPSNDAIDYVMTDQPRGGSPVIELSEADAEVSVVQVANVDSNVLDDLDITDTDYVVVVELTPSLTRDLTPGRNYHELQLVDANGVTATVFAGNVEVRPSVTN